MKPSLPDVNVLIALLDPLHVHHDRAHAWFAEARRAAWLSSPTTQNGVLRIVSHPKYPNHQPLQTVLESLRSLLSVGRHRFVADDQSVLGSAGRGQLVTPERLATSAQVTDTYLLALAAANEAKLATFDRRMFTGAVRGGDEARYLIP
ncbi:MAG: hypothetical protein KF875_11825 [Trueperaceae bacterium]|nr:hypothetical protein [Trueperaceae bacterium]MCC6311733.1 VapC toxin family PIN domain ribonuclease [Trueperaceae bacterium]MCO5173160.1 hypothetical protein [Trueperaceae bacterium]MCW5818438.1 hypothetical protein [Trueperaceae bacterium]